MVLRFDATTMRVGLILYNAMQIKQYDAWHNFRPFLSIAGSERELCNPTVLLHNGMTGFLQSNSNRERRDALYE